MRTTVLGAGPSGLYLGILLKKANPAHEVMVLERNPPDATFGWGVVFSEETLGALADADHRSYVDITDTFARWDAIDISYRGELLRCRGHGFSAIARKRLLAILQARCTELGVDLRFGVDVQDLSTLDGDLVVAADGVNSLVREADRQAFGTRQKPLGCKYIWYGTDLVLDAFRFIFADTEHGLIQVHSYPFDENASTFIVECPEPTWRAAGLDRMTEAESIAYCEKLFAADLRGHRLMSNKSAWLDFPLVANDPWHTGNTVLLGDAAHTAHFTIGSGTKLAMEDAIALANALELHGDDVQAALVEYELERQPVVERFQLASMDSADYFTRVGKHAHLEPPQFAFNLLTRSGRIGHGNLAQRDADFVRTVDAWLASTTGTTRRRISPPPSFTPAQVGGTVFGNRVVADGLAAGELAGVVADGVGLALTELIAVTDYGRVHPGTPVLDDPHPWRAAVEGVHAAGGLAGALLGHAGRRGATRSPERGVDIPLLATEAWPLVAAAALPYGPASQTPRAVTGDDLTRIERAFSRSTEIAADAGFDVLELDCAHGRLLAGFLSPLTNPDGGTLAQRLSFPLRVLAAVRAAWPAERPLFVRLTVADWARRGLTLDDGVTVARAMAQHGADLIHVEAGQTVAESRPEYRRGYLTAASDRVRSEARVPTMVGGYLTTLDEVDTVVAAGRADLCVLDLPREA